MKKIPNKLKANELERRVHDAVQATLDLLQQAKSPTDFYFEEVLNVFIALAQAPLNFAIYKDEGRKLVRIKHFCTDDKHFSEFESASKDVTSSRQAFELLPGFFAKRKLYVAIFSMETKTQPISLVLPKLATSYGVSMSDSGVPYGHLNYVAECAKAFFGGDWGIDGQLEKALVQDYLLTSLEGLSQGVQTREELNRTLKVVLNEIPHFPNPDLPKEDSISYGRDRWKKKLEATFDRVVDNAASGVSFINARLHHGRALEDPDAVQNRIQKLGSRASQLQPLTSAPTLPNMFVAFRAFSRSSDKPRKADPDKPDSGYLYDASFLLPKGAEAKVKDALQQLKKIGQAKHRTSLPYPRYADLIRQQDNSLDEKKRQSALELDELFWALVNGDEKDHATLISVFKSWIGDDTRSMVDPVFHTGLIHTNYAFENFGLDRIGYDDENGQFKKGAEQDGLRLVVFYYLVCSIVAETTQGGWDDTNTIDPTKIAIILAPMKMRGAPWGVVLHALYVRNKEFAYKDSALWATYFNFVTNHYRKLTGSFDRYLWGLATERVRKKLIQAVSSMPEDLTPETEPFVNEVSSEFLQEMRASPFSFPLLTWHLPENFDRSEQSYVQIGPDEPIGFVAWSIIDNEFFVAHQSWDGKSDRDFGQAIERGLYVGFGTEKLPQD